MKSEDSSQEGENRHHEGINKGSNALREETNKQIKKAFGGEMTDDECLHNHRHSWMSYSTEAPPQHL